MDTTHTTGRQAAQTVIPAAAFTMAASSFVAERSDLHDYEPLGESIQIGFDGDVTATYRLERTDRDDEGDVVAWQYAVAPGITARQVRVRIYND
jgi:hypothetical protein